MNRLLKKRTAALALALSLSLSAAMGCSNAGSGESDAVPAQSTQSEAAADIADSAADTQEQVTENAPVNADDVALTIDGVEISAPELFYFYLATRSQMESFMGSLDWSASIQEGMTYGDYLKQLVETQILQNAFWISLANDNGIELSEDEQELVKEDLASFNANVVEADRELYGLNDETAAVVMEHITLASKSMNAEIEKQIGQFTDEEKADCVYRTVQHILLKTEAEASTNESGELETVSESEAQSYKDAQKAKAEEVLQKAQAGEDFSALADEYNEDSGFEYSLNNKGQSPDGATYVQEFTDGAWALKEGEMAIVETEYGYHVMKCVSESDPELNEEAQRSLAVSKYNDIYQQWLTDNNPTFYDGWKNYVVLNTPALPNTTAAGESTGESSDATESGADESADTAESGAQD